MESLNEIAALLVNKPEGSYDVIKLRNGGGTTPLGQIRSFNYRRGELNTDGYLRDTRVWAFLGPHVDRRDTYRDRVQLADYLEECPDTDDYDNGDDEPEHDDDEY